MIMDNNDSQSYNTINNSIGPETNEEIQNIERMLEKLTPEDLHLHAALQFTDVDNMSVQEYDLVIDEISNDLINTPYKQGRVATLVNNCELNINELKQITGLLVEYHIKPASLEKLIVGGIPIKELEEFICIHRDNTEISFDKKKLEPLNPTNNISYFIPNAEDFISFDNLLFVRKITNNGSAEQVKTALYNIKEIESEYDFKVGTGVLVNRMRNLYESNEKYRGFSMEMMTRLAIDSSSDKIYGALDEAD